MIVVHHQRNFSLFILVSVWRLFAEKKECVGAEFRSGWFPNISDCAASCSGQSSMFVYARMDGKYCNNNSECQCYCEIQAKNDGTCITEDAKNWDLYSFVMNNQSKYDCFFYA